MAASEPPKAVIDAEAVIADGNGITQFDKLGERITVPPTVLARADEVIEINGLLMRREMARLAHHVIQPAFHVAVANLVSASIKALV